MIQIQGACNTAICYVDQMEKSAEEQIGTVCDQPAFAGCRVRIRPDVYTGKGCTIGTLGGGNEEWNFSAPHGPGAGTYPPRVQFQGFRIGGATMAKEKSTFVAIEKASKKAQKAYHSRSRGSWNGVVPVTKVLPDKRAEQARRGCRGPAISPQGERG